MPNVNQIKLEKYIPVRKQKKLIDQATVCQKQSIKVAHSAEVSSLPAAA